jgi:4-hydroxyproline epimerase
VPLLLVYRALADGNRRWMQLALERLNTGIAGADALYSPRKFELFGGLSGPGWVIEHVTGQLRRFEGSEERSASRMNEDTDAALPLELQRGRWRGTCDLASGLTGIGPYFLQRFPSSGAKQGLELVLGHLEASAQRSLPFAAGVAGGLGGMLYLLREVAAASVDASPRSARCFWIGFVYSKPEAKVQSASQRIHTIDSHTGGEPTRIVIGGGPPLGAGTMSERLDCLRKHHDHFRSAIVNEPRGSDAVVGAILCDPVDPAHAAGIIFFNNVGYLNMCGHGTIGLGATLAYLGRIKPGIHKLETPVGIVSMELHESGEVTVGNVASYRSAKDAVVDVEGIGPVTGDIAWGGNWFFLTDRKPCELELRNIEELTNYTWRIRQALTAQGITGDDGGEIDHIEVSSTSTRADGKNFVLCPGKAYDRSPCGTGTSAKLACLYADGKLKEGEVWKQESIIGSVFEGSLNVRDGKLFPQIKGSAYISADSYLILQQNDPFRWGIRA